MIATHGMTFNGHIESDVSDAMWPLEQDVRRGLEIMDGERRYAYALWRQPPRDQMYLRVQGWPWSYIQSAGSAEAMTVEIRVSGGMDKVAEQFVVGRPVEDQAAEPVVNIRWNGNDHIVFANEVFEVKEAGDIYWYYYQHDTVPDGYWLRQIAV